MYYKPSIPSKNKKEPEGTTSPYGLWRYGNDYHNASVTLLLNHDESLFTPFFSTSAQSIELSFKAFLLTKGFKVEELRKRKYGHDLTKLFMTSLDKGIADLVNIETGYFACIDLLNHEYKHKKYHYIKTGTMLIPRTDLVINASLELTKSLELYCFANTKWEEEST